MAFQLKYRPKTLKGIVGNEDVVEALEVMLAKKKSEIPHSILLQGPAGCGKTTIARILAKRLGIEVPSSNFIECNASDDRGINEMRDIIAKSHLKPIGQKYKMYLLDEAHMLTVPAQNALLKILEDTPRHTFFVIATTDPQKLNKAIKSRCTTFTVSELGSIELVKLLRRICKKEGKPEYDKKTLKLIAKKSMGSPREAVKLLDQVINIDDPEKAIKAIKNFSSDEADVPAFCKILMNPGDKWADLAPMVKAVDNSKAESTRIGILAYLTAVLLNSKGGRADFLVRIMECFEDNYYNTGKAGLAISCYEASLVQ